MKSFFTDFLQNVTPPGAFKQGYTVFTILMIVLCTCIHSHLVPPCERAPKRTHGLPPPGWETCTVSPLPSGLPYSKKCFLYCATIQKMFRKALIAKQVIPTYISHSRPLIPDGLHLFFGTRFERREKPDLSLYAERQARKHLVPFL